MRKSPKPKKTNRKKANRETPLVVYLWIVGLGFMGYLLARIIFDAYPHPLHWASGIFGAAIGYIAGWLWYRWRGDVI